MLNTRVKLGNVSHVFLNLINIHLSSLVHQLQLLLVLTFAALPYLFDQCLDMYFNREEFIYGTFEDCVGLCNTTIAPLTSKYLPGNVSVDGNSLKVSRRLFTFLYLILMFVIYYIFITNKFITYSCLHLS